ncbi:hypothetical protein [Lederbergia citrea]|uniref:Uncharacterized protein n=1 Tax=Lederbergia citrea TaxID=2833581 RepID=A0A942Z2Q7_9BACI|nr:hypothetical protein [Lederbergia citrea]MBS4221729.1 hypothetical protein [Lederbergia citrea]
MLRVKPTIIAYEDYQNFVLEQLRKHFSGSVLTMVNNDSPIIYKLWITILSFLTSWLRNSYSYRGPEPQDQASMIRSYLLLLLAKPTISITEWVDELHLVTIFRFGILAKLSL